MGLQTSVRKSGDTVILDLQGRVTIGDTNDSLSAELRKLADSGPCNVLVNLAGVAQMDSSGVCTLVRSFVSIKRKGGSLKILRPSGRVRDVLRVTRLLESIPCFEDEAEAIASFRGGTAHA